MEHFIKQGLHYRYPGNFYFTGTPLSLPWQLLLYRDSIIVNPGNFYYTGTPLSLLLFEVA